MAVDFGLFGDAVVLEFEVEILGAEGLFEPIDAATGGFEVVVEDGLGNFAGETAGEGDQAFFVQLQDFFVDAWLIIIALEVGFRGELNQILVADLVFGQQHEMIVNIAAS